VDKLDFLHMLKGLRGVQTAEQGLRLAGTLTGQKNGSAQVAWFRTFDPVDMHGLVHKDSRFADCRRHQRRGLKRYAVSSEPEIFLSSQETGDLIKALLSKSLCRPRRQLYRSRKKFFGETVKTKRVLRFTSKTLYTE
jgi:hypothetical protein